MHDIDEDRVRDVCDEMFTARLDAVTARLEEVTEQLRVTVEQIRRDAHTHKKRERRRD